MQVKRPAARTVGLTRCSQDPSKPAEPGVAMMVRAAPGRLVTVTAIAVPLGAASESVV